MILVAPTSFKGTHSATAATEAAARGARAATNLQVQELPVSDGGQGLIDSLSRIDGASVRHVSVTGPLGEATEARVLMLGSRAVIESADACGLHLVPFARRDPLRTTTYGVGELIRHAAALASEVIVGVGGSATIDCGLGMAQALGWEVPRTLRTCFQLSRAARTHMQALPEITVLTDVHNPLFGPHGAARVFGAQKGASPELIVQLDAELERVAGVIRRDLGVDVASLSGAGAAGGLAAGLHAFADGKLVSGSHWILEQLQFDLLLERATAVITGEGAYDAQSSMGKITGEVIARATARGVPVLLIAGSIDGDVPPNVHAVTSGARLELGDIEGLVREALPRLLS